MPVPFPPIVTVTVLHDPVMDKVGFDPHDPYVSLLWLPVVGPSCLLTYLRLTDQLRLTDPLPVDVEFMAHCMGLGMGTGAHAPITRTLDRLVHFRLAERPDDDTLSVRPKTPWLVDRQLRRLHPDLQRAHRALIAQRPLPRPAGV
jgi:hypothetical protein